MKRLEHSRDMAEMLTAERAALFVWVDWSTYARHGCEIFRRAQSDIGNDSTRRVNAFVADLSFPGATPIADSLHQWLKVQDEEAGHCMFPSIDLANGSVVWIKKGRVTGFESATYRLGFVELRKRFERVFDLHPPESRADG